jgi:DtxR family Mn-dependent transcriptional regulator
VPADQQTSSGRTSATSATEDYVKAIYELDERGAAVTTTALAARLGITPSSVSGMLAKLGGLGLISHRPYADVALTPEGVSLAVRMLRRHRLIELYLVEHLGYRWDEVNDEAEVLEHSVSDLFIERIAAVMGDPRVDPHGDPIPRADGHIDAAPTHLLTTLQPGASGVLVRVWNSQPEVLRYLDDLRISLGDRFEVLRHEPFGGPIVVRIGEDPDAPEHGLGAGLAECLLISVDS